MILHERTLGILVLTFFLDLQGWRFTAVEQQSPRQFFGLRRQSLTSAP